MTHRFTPVVLVALALVAFAAPTWTAPQRQIAERQIPVCDPATEPYIYYSGTSGRWVCTATAPSPVFSDVTVGAVALSATDLAKIDGITNGTAAANKALVTDANSAVNILRTASLRLGASGSETTVARTGAEINLLTQGVAAGYKIARGIHTTVDENDTVVSGLATVVAAICQLQSPPVIGATWVACDIGDQSGAPAAGSFLVKTYKPTATGDATPTVATTFSIAVAWMAIGT
jgi:hypothetical protein